MSETRACTHACTTLTGSLAYPYIFVCQVQSVLGERHRHRPRAAPLRRANRRRQASETALWKSITRGRTGVQPPHRAPAGTRQATSNKQTARIILSKIVGKFHSCMVSKLRIIFKRIVILILQRDRKSKVGCMRFTLGSSGLVLRAINVADHSFAPGAAQAPASAPQ